MTRQSLSNKAHATWRPVIAGHEVASSNLRKSLIFAFASTLHFGFDLICDCNTNGDPFDITLHILCESRQIRY